MITADNTDNSTDLTVTASSDQAVSSSVDPANLRID